MTEYLKHFVAARHTTASPGLGKLALMIPRCRTNQFSRSFLPAAVPSGVFRGGTFSSLKSAVNVWLLRAQLDFFYLYYFCIFLLFYSLLEIMVPKVLGPFLFIGTSLFLALWGQYFNKNNSSYGCSWQFLRLLLLVLTAVFSTYCGIFKPFLLIPTIAFTTSYAVLSNSYGCFLHLLHQFLRLFLLVVAVILSSCCGCSQQFLRLFLLVLAVVLISCCGCSQQFLRLLLLVLAVVLVSCCGCSYQLLRLFLVVLAVVLNSSCGCCWRGSWCQD